MAATARHRADRLPGGIDADRVEADYDNGVLTITVGRTRGTHPRRIEIDRGSGDRQIGRSSSHTRPAGPGSPVPGRSGSPSSRR
ncbi:Hsp20/alpha crystallin family protein [Dactylosporangium sp. CA-139114]|uniref:Hsp20/alpha crystallin family protein n=1 Tax=Dactylosporangium sp. CA-139114 TaxID=3239931 RepID=UPI003D958B38